MGEWEWKLLVVCSHSGLAYFEFTRLHPLDYCAQRGLTLLHESYLPEPNGWLLRRLADRALKFWQHHSQSQSDTFEWLFVVSRGVVEAVSELALEGKVR